ncbi:hypothetical protein ACFSM5_21115 [Lacibacterium aquatile]|uniref:DUF2442 domain-containing protein n=1 Tax=Lacibacterium aquatile TaxID=1168082 RepID=A0ABW5DWX7_9PROT
METIIDVRAYTYPDVIVLWSDQRVQVIDVEKLIGMRPALEPLRDPAVFTTAHVSPNATAIEFIGGHRIDFTELA